MRFCKNLEKLTYIYIFSWV